MGERELPAGWEWKRLGDLFTLSSGKSRPDKIENTPTGTKIFPIYGGNGILGYSDEFFIQNPTIIIGRVGQYCGSVYVSSENCWISDNALYADNLLLNEIDLTYLARALCKINLNLFKKKFGQPLITQKIVYEQYIPLPPLSIQHQIIAVLEQAEAVKRQRQEADALTGALLQNVFYQMFGDPVNNEREWKMEAIGDIANHVSSGSTPRGGSEVYDTFGIMFIRSQNIHMNRLVEKDIAYISEEIHQSMQRSQLIKGDVLFNITGASIGRVAWFTGEDNSANVNQHVCIIRTYKHKILPEFLSYQLSLPSYQNKIMANQSGATRQAFNYSQIKKFDIIMPPLTLQQQFARIVEDVVRIREQQGASGKEIEGLCEGLMQRAFAGELVMNEA